MRNFVFSLILTACSGSSNPPSPDLAPTPPDLFASDFCAGTAVAGSCAQAFFAQAAACMGNTRPCSAEDHLPDGQGYCFDSGAHLSLLAGGGDLGSALYRGVWTNAAGATCLSAVVPGPSRFRMTLTQNNVSLTYDLQSGDVVCPDATTSNIGRVDTCDDIHFLIDPNQCTAGSCPL